LIHSSLLLAWRAKTLCEGWVLMLLIEFGNLAANYLNSMDSEQQAKRQFEHDYEYEQEGNTCQRARSEQDS
jgi:hypothetical protein